MYTYTPLQAGDEIRVIAPSQSKRARYAKSYELAEDRLRSLGFRVSYGDHIDAVLHFNTAKAADRAQDFNVAYQDPTVRAVMALHGGWSANEILPLIDWESVQRDPKPFIGYSDITVLHNAIYAMTGNVSLLGPNFGTLGVPISWEYTLGHLDAVLRQEIPVALARSQYWGVRKSDHITTKPWKVISEGMAESTLIGGNLGTLYLLQGTLYQPHFDTPFIFALEDDDEATKYTTREVARRFESLLQLPGFRDNLCGLVIGRFQPTSKVTESELLSLLGAKELGAIPILQGVDFGHTFPMLTLPIGGKVSLDTRVGKRSLTLLG